MPHVIEPASSGRAKCRGCEQKIAKGDLRFGERQPNAFGEGEMTLWFHLRCAAYKRPEPFLEIASDGDVAEARELVDAAQFGVAHRRLPRLAGAGRSPTGRARCRSCREPIDKDGWRLALTFFEEFRFEPSGFIHAGCAQDYFETIDVVDRVRHFSPDLGQAELEELRRALAVRAQD